MTVDNIMGRIAAIVDQDPDTSNISTGDYALRLRYMNMALMDWSETWNWQTLFREYNVLASTSSANASVVLPSNFRKSAGPALIAHDGANTDVFPETQQQNARDYPDNHKRVAILGNPADGYVLRVYGVDMVSGASIKFPFYVSPTSLATSSDVPMIPNPNYLIKKTIGYLWESREDSRFQLMLAEADQILQNMIEYENMFPVDADYGRVKTVEETQYKFRLGRD